MLLETFFNTRKIFGNPEKNMYFIRLDSDIRHHCGVFRGRWGLVSDGARLRAPSEPVGDGKRGCLGGRGARPPSPPGISSPSPSGICSLYICLYSGGGGLGQ